MQKMICGIYIYIYRRFIKDGSWSLIWYQLWRISEPSVRFCLRVVNCQTLVLNLVWECRTSLRGNTVRNLRFLAKIDKDRQRSLELPANAHYSCVRGQRPPVVCECHMNTSLNTVLGIGFLSCKGTCSSSRVGDRLIISHLIWPGLYQGQNHPSTLT